MGYIIRRIVSGGQTGADRAALDIAIALGYECGGWVPKERLDENGVIPANYPNLLEADDAKPKTRTALNVRDSDATLIFSHGPLLGGSRYTKIKADELGKPNLHLDLSILSIPSAVEQIHCWLAENQPTILNVAGPRASDDSEIYGKTCTILEALLRR